ncbi:hypothetical protein [Bythopirellula polymerisocia]|nr:hypothetical protein [Bythopirellula polymerisocia]
MPVQQFRRLWILHITRSVIVLLSMSIAGCGVVLSTATVSDPQSILRAIKTNSDQVTLEIFQVRIPGDNKQLLDEVWQASDEQRLDLEVRNQLISNGFRAGVISGALPDAVARSLNLQSEMPEEEIERVITGENAAPKIVRRVVQLKRREHATIQASELQEQAHVLLNSENGLQGRTYEQVQGVYSLQAESVPGQKVAIEITPELQFGDLKNRYTGSDNGVLMMTTSRERKVFDQLKLSLDLSSGEFLVISGISESSSSLGSAFHDSRQSGAVAQKLVLIRLLQVPQSEILADAAL